MLRKIATGELPSNYNTYTGGCLNRRLVSLLSTPLSRAFLEVVHLDEPIVQHSLHAVVSCFCLSWRGELDQGRLGIAIISHLWGGVQVADRSTYSMHLVCLYM